MNQQKLSELMYTSIGAITSTGVGAFLLQAVGALILGIMGAAGGYLFAIFIKPKLDKLFRKKK